MRITDNESLMDESTPTPEIDENADSERPPGLNASLDRALAVLRAITDRGPARADELAAELDFPLSTVYRYLRTLRTHGFVADRDGLFGPGPAFDSVRAGGIGRAELIELSLPTLNRLVELTEETAVLAIRVGSHAMCLCQVESFHPIRLVFQIRQALPLYAGAGQRALLAHAPPDVIATVLSEPLRPFAPNTPTRASLPRRLESTRFFGLATSRAELSPGSVAIAAPVFCHDEVVCSITVAGPATRCGRDWQARAKHTVLRKADKLGRLLESTRSRERTNPQV